MVDQDVAHGARGRIQEVLPAIEVLQARVGFLAGCEQLEPDFVHQGGGLEGVVLALSPHQLGGHAAKLSIDDLEEFVFRARLALLDSLEK